MDTRSSSSLQPGSVVLIGLVALAIAMGIGRFAFTPMMPLMVRDGSLDSVTGTEWATANYVGYLLGAISASWFARSPRHGLQIGLVGVAATTLAMAWGNVALPWLGMILRGSAGIFSAWVLVCASSWCLPELARRNSTSLGGWIYTGVGLGIAATGVMTWLGGSQAAVVLWVELGLLTIAGALYVMWHLPRHSAASAPSAGASDRRRPAPSVRSGNIGVVWCSATAPSASATSFPRPSCPRWRGNWCPIRSCSGSPGRSSVRRRHSPSPLPRTGCMAGRAERSGRSHRA